ncbi:MAG: hypothetical protein KDD01_16595, partial [Phaeodactylibacter sp.]|nr:hypothetical protein [Phaeodactylibacter sp.]
GSDRRKSRTDGGGRDGKAAFGIREANLRTCEPANYGIRYSVFERSEAPPPSPAGSSPVYNGRRPRGEAAMAGESPHRRRGPGWALSMAITLLALAFQLHPVYGQRSSSNAAPGLRLPSDTIRASAAIYHLPSMSALPSPRALESTTRKQVLEAPPMPAAYSYDKLGAFCKWEVQLEKAARMPVKFRLGEVQYVERLEGKLPDY